MHLTLKKETTKPPAFNILQQQDKFDSFVEVYNNKRPHQAIAMKYPSELYTPSSRVYTDLPDVDYPFADKILTVTNCWRICMNRLKISLSSVLAGQKVGITQTDDKIWLVTFMNYEL